MAHVLLAAALAMVAAAATGSASPAEGIQPLSKIAIHKATIELDSSAYVRASALLLGDGDQQVCNFVLYKANCLARLPVGSYIQEYKASKIF